MNAMQFNQKDMFANNVNYLAIMEITRGIMISYMYIIDFIDFTNIEYFKISNKMIRA